MLGTDGRQLSADFVRRLAADGIKPAGASDPWSDNGCGILGSTLHGITRQPPSILISAPDPGPYQLGTWTPPLLVPLHMAGSTTLLT